MVLKRRRPSASGGGLSGAAKTARKRSVASKDSTTQRKEEEATLNSDDELTSDEGAAEAGEGDDALDETPDEARVRMAKEYLAKLGSTEETKEDIQAKLNKDLQDQARRSRFTAEDLQLGEPKLLHRGHIRAVTCVALSADDTTAYSGGKDCNVVRWDIETGRKCRWMGRRSAFDCGGHFAPVLSCCLVERRELLLTGGTDRLVRLWDPRAAPGSSCTGTLQGHASDVTGIVAELDGTQVYTTSLDKSMRLWDLRTRRCLDTLFGHTEGITCLDLFDKQRPVTGGKDRTARFWKIDRETHLVMNRHKYSVDAVTAVDHDRFLSGGQDGQVHLWSSFSKRPLASTEPAGGDTWVTALQAIRSCNIVFSATTDCQLRCMRFGRGAVAGGEDGGEQEAAVADSTLRFTDAAPAITAPGVVNDIAVGKRVVVCAVGAEHRLGRWQYEKGRKNGLLVVPVSYRECDVAAGAGGGNK